MNKPMNKHQADVISTGVFLIALRVMFYANAWWPWILLVLGIFLGLRQFLTGRLFDMSITVAIFGTIFIASFFAVTLNFIVPILFILGGLYLIFREYYYKD